MSSRPLTKFNSPPPPLIFVRRLGLVSRLCLCLVGRQEAKTSKGVDSPAATAVDSLDGDGVAMESIETPNPSFGAI